MPKENERSKAVTAVLKALPTLLVALAGVLTTFAATRRATDTKNELTALQDNYGSYIEDNLRRDAATLETIKRLRVICAELEHKSNQQAMALPTMWAKSVQPVPEPGLPAETQIDTLARFSGWEPTK